MNKIELFDVLVVYSESLARSAAGENLVYKSPFAKGSKNESYNIVYGYFLEICKRFGLKAAFATSADITGAGTCKSYWIYNQKKWRKINSACYSTLIFDKFSPKKVGVKTRRELLFSSTKVKPFNDPTLFKLFFDKQMTFDKLAEYTIPTITVNKKNIKTIKNSCDLLNLMTKNHPKSADFSQDIIMKDRYGAGGRHIHKIVNGDCKIMLAMANRNAGVDYVIQPFAKFEQGFTYDDFQVSTDIRLIYLKGKIIQSYIRMAKQGDFRCNEHQGGSLNYLNISQIPTFLVDKSNLIAKKLNNTCSLFTLDFIISNNGNAYLLEGNTGPGLDWNMSLKKNTYEGKRLIRLVVKELSNRSTTAVV